MRQQEKNKREDAGTVTLADLDSLGREELIALWHALYRTEPPPRVRRPLLELACAWAIQARDRGGLSPAAERQLKGAGDARPRRRIKPGTRLVREWHGTVHVVEVTTQGFLWQGRTHASLSAIARAITGANWSGPRFFGLKGG
ncbi:MAG TPA: DUF2924 domain-containing protein [Pseudohaliea sp.]|nr:DUF2924 domain-containing protein [Pseudohaliea sp.]